MQKVFGILFFLIPCFCGCGTMGPQAIGDTDESFYLAPHDRIQLDNGDNVYVDGDGILRGIPNIQFVAVGRKVRDVMQQLTTYIYFEKYKVVEFGKRYIEVGGVIQTPYHYHELPIHEDWTVNNVLSTIQGFVHKADAKEYLLVRKAAYFPNAYLFVRGKSESVAENEEGDDILVFSGDRMLFPGDKNLIYVFGAVQNPVCFLFAKGALPTLKDAAEQAQGYLKTANLENVLVYRVLNLEKQAIFHLDWNLHKDFVLSPWDIVYFPFQIPKNPNNTSGMKN